MSVRQRLYRLDTRMLGGLATRIGLPRTLTVTSDTARELWGALPPEDQERLERAARIGDEMADPRNALIVSEMQANIVRWHGRNAVIGLVLVAVIAVVVLLVSDVSWWLVAGPIAGSFCGAALGVGRVHRAQQANTDTARNAGLV